MGGCMYEYVCVFTWIHPLCFYMFIYIYIYYTHTIHPTSLSPPPSPSLHTNSLPHPRRSPAAHSNTCAISHGRTLFMAGEAVGTALGRGQRSRQPRRRASAGKGRRECRHNGACWDDFCFLRAGADFFVFYGDLFFCVYVCMHLHIYIYIYIYIYIHIISVYVYCGV